MTCCLKHEMPAAISARVRHNHMKLLIDAPINKGTKVFVRCDLDVPVENGIIKETLSVSETPDQSKTVTVTVKTVKADSLKQSLTKRDSAKNLVAETAKEKSVKKKKRI